MGNEITINELKNELEKLEHKYFIHTLQDCWNSEDYRYSNQLQQQILEIKNKIKELV